MKKMRRFLAFVLCAALCFLLLTGCGSRDTIRFKMIAELNQEEFCVAFRKGDPLCDIFTAALKELSADGQISRLSAQYLGTDYTCMEALPGALQLLETQPEPGRKLRIGVQDGIAPISSSRDDGSFGGLIPDLAQLVAEKLGWTFEYMVINSDNVAAELGSGNITARGWRHPFPAAQAPSPSPPAGFATRMSSLCAVTAAIRAKTVSRAR